MVISLKGNPEQWSDGIVAKRSHFLVVIAEDGSEYRIPERDTEGLAAGVRVQFVPRQGTFRKQMWSKKLLLRP